MSGIVADLAFYEDLLPNGEGLALANELIHLPRKAAVVLSGRDDKIS